VTRKSEERLVENQAFLEMPDSGCTRALFVLWVHCLATGGSSHWQSDFRESRCRIRLLEE